MGATGNVCFLCVSVVSLTLVPAIFNMIETDRMKGWTPVLPAPNVQVSRCPFPYLKVWDVFYQVYYVWFSLCVGRGRKKRKGSQDQESSHRGNSPVRTYIRGRHSSLQLISVIECVLASQVKAFIQLLLLIALITEFSVSLLCLWKQSFWKWDIHLSFFIIDNS